MQSTTNAVFVRRWNAEVEAGAFGAPVLSAQFVAEQGPDVHLVDVRPPPEATGVVGYIAGSVFADEDQLALWARDGTLTKPTVVVSAKGARAAAAVHRLQGAGRSLVAALDWGLAGWRAEGLRTSRDPVGVRTELFPKPLPDLTPGELTIDEVRAHVGDPRMVRWIKIPGMLARGRVSCIDGRDERGIIGAPGGDGGEFLLALAALERVTGRELSEADIEQGLLEHLDAFGAFYVHTDTHAFEALLGALRSDARFSSLVPADADDEAWLDVVQHPPAECRDALLEHLVEPAHLGCGHIRLMLQHSEEYGTRPGLVLAFLRAFFRLLWAGSPELAFTVLPGEHDERAVLSVHLDGDLWALSYIPLVSPSVGGQQAFVNHDQAAAFFRELNTQFLVRAGGTLRLDPDKVDAYRAALDEIGGQQLGATVRYLAAGLPIYRVVFTQDGDVVVRSPAS